MRKLISLIAFSILASFQIYSQSFEEQMKELVLTSFSEFSDFSKYGLKWGMSKYEAEGYLKNLSISGKFELAAKGKLFGYYETDFILSFENGKLNQINTLKILKKSEKEDSHIDAYLFFLSEMHNFLNPANRISKLGVREFYEENPRAKDVWVYNEGKSAAILLLRPLDSDMVLEIIFTGANDTDVITLTLPEEFIKTVVEAKNVFYKKASNSSIPFKLKSDLGFFN